MCTTRRFLRHDFRRRAAAAVAGAAFAFAGAGASAQAQQKSSTGPAAAFGGGRAAGDPRGAVRALGSVEGESGGSKSGGKMVKVPHLGGESPQQTRGVPLGTSR